MDFNPRASMAPRSSQQQSSQQKKVQQADEEFMKLSDREIAGCIYDIGISFTVEDLRKPNPQQIQKIFEWFGELLTNTTRELVAPAMKAAAEDMCGDDADKVFTPDTRELMGFFITMRKLLLECGIKDFTFSDLYNPKHDRLVKIFSYIINFIRFRESQTAVIDEHYNSSERTKNMIEELYRSNQQKEEQLQEMQQNRKSVEQTIKDKEKRYQELKAGLLQLHRAQEQIAEKHGRVKTEQERLKTVLEEKHFANINIRQEAKKLRPYTEQSPAVLEQALRDLYSNLNSDRAEIDRLDKRTRALQTSSETFTTLQTEVTALTRLLNEVQSKLREEEEEARTATKHRDALAEKSNNVRDVETKEKMLRKQLEQLQSRTQKLRDDADSKAGNAKQKMEGLRASHRELTAQRNEKGEEVERRRARIEQTEKKMLDLKENIEQEVQSAREEYMKMESHIRLYITEMEQSI